MLDYWTRPDREWRLFFCQIKVVETIIYLTEIAPRRDANHGTFILKRFKQANAGATPDSLLVSILVLISHIVQPRE